MSVVDERIVKMVFDNADFIKKIGPTISGLTQLNKATDDVANNSGGGVSAIGKAFEQAEIMSTKAGFHIRDVWLKVASILEYQVAGKIVNIGKQIANAMTFEGISDGFKEYELKMGSVQTIMAGTGASLQEVNKYLEELNAYSDKTIYSFADMTNNIGKFTNAGVELDDAVLAIKGIANEAARSGANANEASRAMYNFSQALSAGYVKLIDWKSIENANMATKEFKDTLLEVASAAGTVEKQEDGMYKVLGKNANGATMKEAMSATKNFNDSLSYQWMTTDVLTKTMKIYATDVRDLSEAEKAAWESELKSMGFNEEQIKRFEDLGSAATDAASEVKTFSMLIDTLKEAIGSGWAQTWEILIGDFEEAKTLWTAVSNVLGGVIDESSKSRNNLLKDWDALGGRRVIIDALKRAFDALVAVIKPVGEAFRKVFPPATATNLYNISKAIQRFAAGLMISEETAVKVRHAASGFFSILDIGLKLVKSFVKAILPAGKGVTSLAGFFLDVADKIGIFLTKVDIVITKTQLFDRVFQGVANVLKSVFGFLKGGLSGILGFISGFAEGFSNATGPINTFGDVVEAVFKGMSSGFDSLKSKLGALQPLLDGLVSILKGIGKFVGTIFKQIGETLSGFSFGGNGIGTLMNLINAFITGGILHNLLSGAKAFSSLGDIFNSISDVIGGFQEKIKAETLMEIAKAIAIMAGSLFLIAMIDSNKLAGATAAITAMMAGLAGAITVMMKAINSFGSTDMKKSFSIFGKQIFGSNATKILEMAVTLGAVSKALVAMGAAILMMSVGLKVVSSAAEGGHLWDSFAVITLMLTELTAVALVLGKWGGNTKGATNGLLTMSAALIVMAKALQMISGVVAIGNAWESLAILGLMVAGLTGVMIAIDKLTKYKAMSMLPLISMAISINLLVLALKAVSDALGQDGQHIWQALAIVGIMAAGLAAVCVVLSKFAAFSALGGAGAILAAVSILILVQALKQISDALGQTDQHIWQALGVIAASLLILAVGLAAMAASIPGAGALLIASAALIVLGAALKIMGSMKLSEIGKGLLAMAGSLIILAVGLTAMILALPGAAALVVAAFGLTILAGALKLFGSMKLSEIVKSLGMLVVALAGIAVITTVLSVLSPFVIAFSAALLVFGVALIATGVGLTMFSAGLQALVAVLPMGISALNLLAVTLLNLIPIIAEKLMDALGIIATKIVEYGPQFTAAAVAIIDYILTAIVQSAVKFGEAVLQVILGILQVLTENIPLIAQAGTDLMIAYMEAIATEIPRLVDQAYKCAIEFINGLASAIEANNGDLIAAVDNLMSAVIQAITQWLVEFTPLGLLIPENMKEGIMTGEVNVKDAFDDMIKNVIDSLKEKVTDFKEAAKDFLSGFLDGLKDAPLIGGIVTAATNVGSLAVEAIRSKKGIDAHSPSWLTWLTGKDFDEGFENGIVDNSDGAIDAATDLGDGTIGALSDTVSTGVDEIDDSLGSLGDLFDDAEKEISDYDSTLVEVTNTMDEFSTAAARSEKFMEKNAEKTHDGYMATMEVIEAERKRQKAKEKETEAVEANTEAQEENATATGKSGGATKKSADLMKSASGVIEEFTKQYGHLYSELGDDAPVKVAEIAIKRLAEATYKASLTAQDAAEENGKTKASVEDMVKAFTDMKKKVYDSVKGMFEGDSFFQKFEVKTEKSMKDMLEGMRSNVNAVSNWTSKLKELAEKGLEQGLLQQLAELGPKGFEYVNAFSNATAEEIQEANQLFIQAGTLPDSASNSVVASYAKAGLNAVLGFKDGIANNTAAAAAVMRELGITSLAELEAYLEINSPSKKTYRDGMYVIMGIANGITNYSYLSHNATVTATKDIVKTVGENLAKSKFYEYGRNIAFGLADGMTSEESLKRVKAAAETLSAIADSATAKYNDINSPSKLYKKYGDYIAQGLALGITGGESRVEKSAQMLSEAIKNTMDVVETIAKDDMEIHPVISPVLDLKNLRSKAGSIGGLFPGQSIAMASSIGIGKTNSSYDIPQSVTATAGGPQISFTQNNYSPKALSRTEIYRQTRNQLSALKAAY